jgi:hypothetical protein
VINCPGHTGSHLILPCITPKIHAHIKKAIIRFFILNFEDANRYIIGNDAHNKADIKIHRFCPEDRIQK